MQIFTEAVLLVAEIEAQVSGKSVPAPNAQIGGQHETVSPELSDAKVRRLPVREPIEENHWNRPWLDTKFLRMGIWERLTKSFEVLSVSSLSVAFFLIFSISWLIISPGSPSRLVIGVIILIPLLLPLLMMLPFTFSKPSTYADSGVSPENVKSVVTHLENRGFTTAEEIELLKKSVKPFEDQTRSRVTALKWIVSLIWAGFIYTLNTHNTSADLKGPDYSIYGPYILMTLGIITYFCVWGYEAALDKLFRAIEFGCNDICFHLAQKETES
jgi:hypothetical protein